MTPKKKTTGQILLDYFYIFCEFIHRLISAAWHSMGKSIYKITGPMSWPYRLSILSIISALILGVCSYWLIDHYWTSAEWEKPILNYFEKNGTLITFASIKSVILMAAGLMLLSAIASWKPSKVTLYVIKAAGAAALTSWLWLGYFLHSTASELVNNVVEFDKYTRYDFLMDWSVLYFPILLALLFFLLTICLKDVNCLYKGIEVEKNFSDQIVENITTGGKDPKYRSSWNWSLGLHVSILVLPFLMKGCMMEGYRLPKGDGAQPQVVKIKKIKKKKIEQLVFNPNSAISYYVPELNKKVLEELEEQTENQYKSQSLVGKNNNKSGKPGWPNGMENAKVRFIRLKYKGGDWDQNMGHGADYNFLLEFKKLTGFNIARDTEAIEVEDIKRFPKKQKPPFLYMTGKGGISLSSREIKTLRTYLTDEGGMLFADNGGGRFNQSLRSLMRRVFPDKQWIDISNDDYIYQQPFLFPNGAPPLWHHSGTRALGIKHNGRWVAFYHQGDINDAWQTGGSGVSEATRSQAFKMGINVVNYAFNQYMNLMYGEE